MRLIQFIFSLFAALLVAASFAADNGQSHLLPNSTESAATASARASFQAILVVASENGSTDASLAQHEATLKRVLRFKSFRRVGGASSKPLAAQDETTIAIGGGYQLDIWVNWMTEREVDFGVRWFKGNQTFVNSTMTRPRRSTTALGGPAVEGGDGHYAVIVRAE